MPSTGKHLAYGRRHYDAARRAGEDEVTRAWGAVALFYSAHQLVHAVLDSEANLVDAVKHPESHGTSANGPLGTNSLVARLYVEIDLPYRSLFAAGKAVRYKGARVTDADMAGYLDDYASIAAWARTKLTSAGRTLTDWP